jgi:hypothetical protein
MSHFTSLGTLFGCCWEKGWLVGAVGIENNFSTEEIGNGKQKGEFSFLGHFTGLYFGRYLASAANTISSWLNRATTGVIEFLRFLTI